MMTGYPKAQLIYQGILNLLFWQYVTVGQASAQAGNWLVSSGSDMP